MIRVLCLAWLALLLPLAALAQPVRVTSGEHDGFTRLVLDYGSPQDWQVGRTLDGYALRLTGPTPTYDLTGVYDLIGRGRLAAVWVDPATQALRIGIGCACHAQPFEFRPGIVVIDLKDGPPPKGSSFEIALGGVAVPDLADRPGLRPRPRPAAPAPASPNRTEGYDWAAVALGPDPLPAPANPATADAPPPAPDPLPDTDPDLQPLRDVLLHQLSRGAAQGVIDMAHPPAQDTDAALPDPPSGPVRIRLQGLPGVRIDGDPTAPARLTAAGAGCLADDRLDLASWGGERPVSEQMADATTGLMGEFDAPDPAAVLRAVRFLLFIGFGAEARQMLAQLPVAQPDAAILTSLAHILDGSREPAPAFAGMAACDTAAALWAILGDPAPVRGEAFDRAAALRSFSALPVHLRRWLAARLADRFMALDDAAAAESVRDAVLRAPGDAGPEVALMQARLDLEAGDPARADRRLTPLIAPSGPATPEALIAQVATHLAQRAPLDPAQIVALEGVLHERRNSPDAARTALAVTQARALAGEFDAAFLDLATVPQAAVDVWTLLAEIGPDSALLAHAVLPEGAAPSLPAPVADQVARRLSDLGLSTEARTWLRQVPQPDPHLAARIALQTGDARSALRLIAGSDDPETGPLRAEALGRLGEEAALAEVLAGAGDQEARWRAVARARDWSLLAASGPAVWQAVAAVATGRDAAPPESNPGPLEQGHALATASAQTRQAVADLLASVAVPTRSDP